MSIGIIVGTNREDSFSEKIAGYYSQRLTERNREHEIIHLKDLPHNFIFSNTYGASDPAFASFQKQIDAHPKLIFIIPEYNGSFPGVLKSFVDALRHPDSFSRKKIALVGVSSGAYGNAVGLSHFSDVLAYLNADILGLRLKLANILAHFSDGAFTFEVYARFVEKQIDTFIEF
ncbi:NADPH-dependent FMN reductase [Leadbetterella sp. DM7]|uniref:NADPH-dependent FMN reductase n=1 Tax=Leadbetterella sp. DM7 TaxID=3235085 RepID=UPI00349E54EE